MVLTPRRALVVTAATLATMIPAQSPTASERDLGKHLERCETRIESAQKELIQALRELGQARKELGDLQRDRLAQARAVADLQRKHAAEVAALKTQLADCQKSLGKRISTAEAQRQALEHRLRGREAQDAPAAQQARKLATELAAAKQARLRDAETLRQELARRHAELGQMLQQAQAQVEAVRAAARANCTPSRAGVRTTGRRCTPTRKSVRTTIRNCTPTRESVRAPIRPGPVQPTTRRSVKRIN